VERARLLEVEAFCAALSGNAAVARARYAEAKRIFEELRLDGLSFVYGYCGGMIERLGGNLEEAVREWTACGDALSEAGDHLISAYVHALRAGLLLELGHVTEADEAVRRARADSLRWDPVAEVAWRSVDARLKAARGEPERGLARAREAVDRSAGTDALILIGDAALAQAEVAATCERMDEAEKALRKAVAAFAAKGCEPLRLHALDRAGRLGIGSAVYSKQN
jgi:tetratricopeptide (TPR) repeat protein